MYVRIRRTAEAKINVKQLKVGDKIQIMDSWWKVLEIQERKILIWKCTNIENHPFNTDGSNFYEGSDIQKYIQSEFWEDLPDDMIERLTKEGFFLLTMDQINKYMPNPADKIATDKFGYGTWWWTASRHPGNGSIVHLINPEGIVYGIQAINSNGVAPACWLEL